MVETLRSASVQSPVITPSNPGEAKWKKGKPVLTVFPKAGFGWDVEDNAIIKKPNIKSSAKTFLNWAIGASVMKVYAQCYPITVYDTCLAVPEGYPADPSQQLIQKDFEWAAKNRDRILQEWARRYDVKSEAK